MTPPANNAPALSVVDQIHADKGGQPVPSSWSPVDLHPILHAILEGREAGPVPTLMPRADGVCLLYPGELHSLAAEPESGKSWIALAETARLIGEGHHVLYVDFEDSAANLLSRLLHLGAPATQLAELLILVRPEQDVKPGELARLLKDRQIALAVIDGVTEAMGLLGLEVNSNDDVAKFRGTLARPLARHGAAVLELDHVVKDAQSRGRFALGGGHKLAGVAVAYSLEAVTRPSRTRAGLLKLTVQKDRHGRIREHEDHAKVIALAHVRQQDGVTVVDLQPPDSEGEAGTFRPTTLMGHASDWIAANPGCTRNQIFTAVGGKREAKQLALQLLIDEGYVERTQHGQSHRHTLLNAFDPSTGAPRPNRGPTEARPRLGEPGPRGPAPLGASVPGPGDHAPSSTEPGPAPRFDEDPQ